MLRQRPNFRREAPFRSLAKTSRRDAEAQGKSVRDIPANHANPRE